MIPPTISDYAWYYLYHKPRYALDKRYRERLNYIEELLRRAHKLSAQREGKISE